MGRAVSPERAQARRRAARPKTNLDPAGSRERPCTTGPGAPEGPPKRIEIISKRDEIFSKMFSNTSFPRRRPVSRPRAAMRHGEAAEGCDRSRDGDQGSQDSQRKENLQPGGGADRVRARGLCQAPWKRRDQSRGRAARTKSAASKEGRASARARAPGPRRRSGSEGKQKEERGPETEAKTRGEHGARPTGPPERWARKRGAKGAKTDKGAGAQEG